MSFDSLFLTWQLGNRFPQRSHQACHCKRQCINPPSPGQRLYIFIQRLYLWSLPWRTWSCAVFGRSCPLKYHGINTYATEDHWVMVASPHPPPHTCAHTTRTHITHAPYTDIHVHTRTHRPHTHTARARSHTHIDHTHIGPTPTHARARTHAHTHTHIAHPIRKLETKKMANCRMAWQIMEVALIVFLSACGAPVVLVTDQFSGHKPFTSIKQFK